ncbi:MAG: UDP-2,3-diacylglucosamine diphosphatase [Cyclobacteriaceae bacterium]|nr:UDP-2,3-diacylglucosamine diphosphatase [Cyclobacteriaceae bacterium]
MSIALDTIPIGKKIYFASDFHLGVPSKEESLLREQKIVRWMDQIKPSAHAVFFLGDIFDFWFEYKWTIPKGFIRFQGKLAEFVDQGIPVYFFTGNHDMWMFDYFSEELGIPIFRKNEQFEVNGKKFFIGHGDGLGPGDSMYKLLKKVFANKICQWLFARIHPNLGMSIANMWSRNSRINSTKKEEKQFGEEEHLFTYSKAQEKIAHHDFYIYGHRHLPLDMVVSKNSRYINLGEWVNHYSYAEFDGKELSLRYFEKE